MFICLARGSAHRSLRPLRSPATACATARTSLRVSVRTQAAHHEQHATAYGGGRAGGAQHRIKVNQMAKLKLSTLKPRLSMVGPRLAAASSPSAKRMTGRKLQERRLRVWSASPHCAQCGALTMYPAGFELDHQISLFAGGDDSDANSQVLCVFRDAHGRKAGCHVAKTRLDLNYERQTRARR